jgi:hypothetical protein
MKTVSEKTWKLRPAIAMFTPWYELPELLDDIPPPVACRIREMMSQVMKM